MIYRNGFEYLRYGYVAVMTLTMFVATALIVYLQYRIVKRWRHASLSDLWGFVVAFGLGQPVVPTAGCGGRRRSARSNTPRD